MSLFYFLLFLERKLVMALKKAQKLQSALFELKDLLLSILPATYKVSVLPT